MVSARLRYWTACSSLPHKFTGESLMCGSPRARSQNDNNARIITAVYKSASGSDIGQREGYRSLAINVCEAVLHRKASGHPHASGVPHDVGIPGKRRDGTSDELGGF